MGGEEGSDEDQRIKAQEDADGIGDLIRALVCGQGKESQKERQKRALADAPEVPPGDSGRSALAFVLRNRPRPP